MSLLAAHWRRWRRIVLARRRSLAALLAAVAVLAGVRAAGAPAAPTSAVTVARVDLPGGTVLRAGHLETRRLPRDAVPAGAAADPGR